MAQTTDLCDGTPVFTPETPCHEGCPLLTKIRYVLIPQGVCAIVEWGLRHPDGATADLLACFPNETSVSVSTTATDPLIKVRIGDCDGRGTIYEVTGSLVDGETGRVRFQLPQEVFNETGIYLMHIGIVDSVTGAPIFIDAGLLTVEDTMFGNTTVRTGPPTFGDIRVALRDTPLENDLLDDVEFDVPEIIHAITYPVLQWNETPPPVAVYNCRTFPFKYHWRQAIIGELLRISSHHYMRNNLKINHAGVQGNFKDKYEEYLGLAESYRQEWIVFITQKKIEINAGMAFATLGSTYNNTF